MNNYTYTVTVSASTKDQADLVMSERINHDEDYGFNYEIGYQQEDK